MFYLRRVAREAAEETGERIASRESNMADRMSATRAVSSDFFWPHGARPSEKRRSEGEAREGRRNRSVSRRALDRGDREINAARRGTRLERDRARKGRRSAFKCPMECHAIRLGALSILRVGSTSLLGFGTKLVSGINYFVRKKC